MTERNDETDRTVDDDANRDPRIPSTGEPRRRSLLATIAAGGSLATAGCLGLYATPEPRQVPQTEDEDQEAEGETFEVMFEKQGETIEVGEEEPLLEAGEDQGWDLPYDCREGFCGECTAKVNGDAHDLVEMTNNEFLTEEEMEEGYTLTCTGKPRDDFAIETGEQPTREYEIEFVNEEETLVLPGANPPERAEHSLLEAALEQGWDVPYEEECEEGWCGECTAKVDGNGHETVWMWNNEYLDQREIEAGYVLTCTGYPLDHFAIETGEQPELDPPGEAETHGVEYVNFDETIEVAEDEAFLMAGEEEWGRDHEELPYNCREGLCGICTAKTDGEVGEDVEMTTNEVLSEELMEEGYTLTCTGEPRDDVSLETNVYDEVRDDIE